MGRLRFYQEEKTCIVIFLILYNASLSDFIDICVYMCINLSPDLLKKYGGLQDRVT